MTRDSSRKIFRVPPLPVLHGSRMDSLKMLSTLLQMTTEAELLGRGEVSSFPNAQSLRRTLTTC